MMDRMQKVVNCMDREFPQSGDVALALGINAAVTGKCVVVFQESEDMLITDNTSQTRTIGVRIVTLAKEMDDAMAIMKRAEGALLRDRMIRVFDRTGAATEVDEELPTPEGMCSVYQRIDLR